MLPSINLFEVRPCGWGEGELLATGGERQASGQFQGDLVTHFVEHFAENGRISTKCATKSRKSGILALAIFILAQALVALSQAYAVETANEGAAVGNDGTYPLATVMPIEGGPVRQQ